MSKTVIKCCDGTEVDVSKMTVEEAVAKLKELASTTTCPCHLESEHGADVTMLSLTVNPTKTGLYYELTRSDIWKPTINMFGKAWRASTFIGRVVPMDVGKRVYLVRSDVPGARSIVQVENDEQFRKRTGAKSLGWRVGKPRRKPETDEWVVPVYDPSGKRDEGKTYYTDDKGDAWSTYAASIYRLGQPEEPEMAPEPKPKETGKITWKYNRYGHVEVWKGDEDEEEADIYIQQEEDVNEFFRKIGVDPETVGPGDFDTAEDPGYFDGVSEQYEQTGGDYKTRDK